VLLTACAEPTASSDPTTTGPVTTTGSGFATATIEVAGTELKVWVADTPSQRAQGLREVEALPEGVDGMLFVWETPTTPTFGMRDTLIPLDIWWFDADGVLIGMTEMRTCPDGDCVSYAAPGPVRWALETPAGAHDFPPEADLTTSANE